MHASLPWPRSAPPGSGPAATRWALFGCVVCSHTSVSRSITYGPCFECVGSPINWLANHLRVHVWVYGIDVGRPDGAGRIPMQNKKRTAAGACLPAQPPRGVTHCTHMYIHTLENIHAYVNTCMYIRPSIRKHACIRTHMYICTYI